MGTTGKKNLLIKGTGPLGDKSRGKVPKALAEAQKEKKRRVEREGSLLFSPNLVKGNGGGEESEGGNWAGRNIGVEGGKGIVRRGLFPAGARVEKETPSG